MINVQGMLKRRKGNFTPLVYCVGLAIFTLQSRRYGSCEVGVERLKEDGVPLLILASAPNTAKSAVFVREVHCISF